MPAAPSFVLDAPKEEAKVEAKFWNRQTSSFATSYQPSSLQKRKHQINSLAHAAMSNAGELQAVCEAVGFALSTSHGQLDRHAQALPDRVHRLGLRA